MRSCRSTPDSPDRRPTACSTPSDRHGSSPPAAAACCRAESPPNPGTRWSSPPVAPPASRRAWSTPTPRSTASAVATSARLDVDPDRDRWVACLPLAHIGGLSVVTRSLVTGTPCTVLDRFDATAVEAEARRGATLVSLVATALGRCDASGYRAVLLGGAAPPTALPANVVTTYGMTETGSGCVYDGRPLGRGRPPHR